MNKYGAEQPSQDANINGVCFSGFASRAASVGANRRIQANKVASAPHGDNQQTQGNNGCLVSIPLVRSTQHMRGVRRGSRGPVRLRRVRVSLARWCGVPQDSFIPSWLGCWLSCGKTGCLPASAGPAENWAGSSRPEQTAQIHTQPVHTQSLRLLIFLSF